MAFYVKPANSEGGNSGGCSPYSYFTVDVTTQGTAQDQMVFKSTLYAATIQKANIVEGDRMPSGQYFVTRHANYETIYYGDGTNEIIYSNQSCTWTHTWNSVSKITLQVTVNYTETWYDISGKIISGPTTSTTTAFSQNINIIPKAIVLPKANVRPGFVFSPRVNWTIANFTLDFGLTYTFSATTQLTVGPSMIINSGNNITFSAPSIYFENGFWAQAGSQINTNLNGLDKRHTSQSDNQGDNVAQGDIIKDDSNSIKSKTTPTIVALEAFPNPFNPTININYQIPALGAATENVSLSVYDIAGQLINKLVDKYHSPGIYSIRWNTCSQEGSKIPCGIYVLELKVRNNILTKKVVFAK